MAENLNKIWAKARPLSDYFQSLLDNNPIDEAILNETTSRLNELASDNPAKVDNFLRSLESITTTITRSRLEKDRRTKLISLLRDQLVGEEIVLIGRFTSEGSPSQIVEVPSEYWIAASIEPEAGRADLSSQFIDELRIKHASSAVRLEAKSTESVPVKPGPKTLVAIRREAITACCQTNSNLLLQSPATRVQAYTRYLEKAYPKRDLRRGFSVSAFQADESILRESREI